MAMQLQKLIGFMMLDLHPGDSLYCYSVDKKWIIPHFEKMLDDNDALIDQG